MTDNVRQIHREANVPFTQEQLTRVAVLAAARKKTLMTDVEVGSENTRRDYRLLGEIEARAIAALVSYFPEGDKAA